MAKILDALTAEVTNDMTVMGSATTLITGFAARQQAAVEAALGNGATAEELVPVQAEPALSARDVMRRRDSVADFKSFDPFTSLDDHASDLVSQDERNPVDPVPLETVGPAYTARLYLY